jgi:hypothetical protein
MTLVPVNGAAPDFRDNICVFPTHGVGLSAFIACDLIILNDPGMKKVGYYRSEFQGATISNDGLTQEGEQTGAIILPCEVY